MNYFFNNPVSMLFAGVPGVNTYCNYGGMGSYGTGGSIWNSSAYFGYMLGDFTVNATAMTTSALIQRSNNKHAAQAKQDASDYQKFQNALITLGYSENVDITTLTASKITQTEFTKKDELEMAVTNADTAIKEAEKEVSDPQTGLTATQKSIKDCNQKIKDATNALKENGLTDDQKTAYTQTIKTETERLKALQVEEKELLNLQKSYTDKNGKLAKDKADAVQNLKDATKDFTDAKTYAANNLQKYKNMAIDQRNKEDQAALDNSDGCGLSRIGVKNFTKRGQDYTRDSDLTSTDLRSLLHRYRTATKQDDKKALRTFIITNQEELRNIAKQDGKESILDSVINGTC